MTRLLSSHTYIINKISTIFISKKEISLFTYKSYHLRLTSSIKYLLSLYQKKKYLFLPINIEKIKIIGLFEYIKKKKNSPNKDTLEFLKS